MQDFTRKSINLFWAFWHFKTIQIVPKIFRNYNFWPMISAFPLIIFNIWKKLRKALVVQMMPHSFWKAVLITWYTFSIISREKRGMIDFMHKLVWRRICTLSLESEWTIKTRKRSRESLVSIERKKNHSDT